MKKLESNMSATTLRTVLVVVIVLLISLSAVGFYFGQSWLRTQAVAVSNTIADSRASGNDIQSLQKLQQDLAARQDVVTKASSIVSSSQNYQTQTIQDLDKYSLATGVGISNYNFVQPVAAPVAPPTGMTVAPVGASSTSVTITLTSPTSYRKLLQFMTAIESNLPKMQISSINLGRVSDGGNDSVTASQLTIEIYTR